MNIKEFKLKNDINIDELLKDGFGYSIDCKYLSKFIPLKGSVVVWLKVYSKDLSLEVEVIDDDFGQYYYPFYRYKETGGKTSSFLEDVIDRYNFKINSLNSFIEVNNI